MSHSDFESGRRYQGTALDAESLRPEDLLAIDEICDGYETAWRAGDHEPDMDAFLAHVKPELRNVAREELLAVAHHWRHERGKAVGDDLESAPLLRSGKTRLSDAIYSRLGHQFQLEQRLGSGATGEVWKAVRRQTGEVVAIKIPHAALLGSLTALIRFCREARWQTRLRHPRTGAPEEVVMAGELPVLVSRFIDGVTLKDYLRENRLSVDEAVELVIQIADGLEYSHAMGIVHRDLKPANVMLERLPDGNVDPARPVIVDFGLAIAADQPTVTHESQTLGTPAYMSPEQARGGSHAAGVPSDIYSLGVIFFESLTGRLPIEGSDVPTLLHNVIYDSPHALRSIQRDLPADLEQICAACLRKTPQERYQSARDFTDDLRRWCRHETIRMQRPNVISRVTQWSKRHPSIVTSAVSILLAVVATTLLIIRGSYVERLQLAYDKSTRAIHAAKSAQQELESHLVAYRMGRIGAYWRLNNPEQAKSLLEECLPSQRTWEWRHFNRLVTRYHRELRHSRDSDEGRFTVRALAVTSDGNTLFSGSRAGTIYRWDLKSNSDLPDLIDTHPGGILAIACSPDDRLVCYGTHHGLCLVRKTEGDSPAIHTVNTAGLAVHTVAFSPDGKQLAIGGGHKVSELFSNEEGFVIILDVESGKEVYHNRKFDRCVVAVDWHPSGDRLLGAGGVASRHPDSLRSRGTVWIWNTTTWKDESYSLPRIARGIDWSPADPDLFAVSMGDGNQALWSASAGQAIKPLPPLTSGAMVCQFSPDGKVLAAATEDGTCSLWNVEDGKMIISYHAHSEGISSLLFSADNQLITGGLDEYIRFWEATPPQEPSLDTSPLGKFASSTQYGDYILLAVNDVEAQTGRIYAIEFAKQLSDFNPKLLFELPSPILKIACATGGDQTLVAILQDDTLNQMHLRDELFTAPRDTSQNTSKAWRLLPFTVRNEFVRSRLHMVYVPGRTFINTVEFATVSAGTDRNENRVWSIANDESAFDSFNESTRGTGRCFAVSTDSKLIATASDQNYFSVWSGNPFEVAHVFSGHARVVSALSFSPNGKQIASGSWDRSVLVWSLKDQSRLQALKGHSGNVLAITFHPTEPRIFTAGSDRQIRIWDTATGLETATLIGHKAPIINLYFDSRGDRLLSIDDSGQVRCW